MLHWPLAIFMDQLPLISMATGERFGPLSDADSPAIAGITAGAAPAVADLDGVAVDRGPGVEPARDPDHFLGRLMATQLDVLVFDPFERVVDLRTLAASVIEQR